EIDSELNLEKFVFTVPYSAKGTSVSFVPGKSDGTWYTKNPLALTIPSEFAAVSSGIEITTQPTSETIAMTGAAVTLSVEAASEDDVELSYQWQLSSDDGVTWTACENAAAADYSFIMSAELAGTYRCVITDEAGAEAVSDTATVREPVTPTVTGDSVMVVKENGSEFAMFKVAESSVVQDGENLLITITTNNISYDKIYFGSKEDEDKSSAVVGTQLESGGWSFTFTISASLAGQAIPVTLGYPEGSTKDWYTTQYLWMYIPAVASENEPSADDDTTTGDPSGDDTQTDSGSTDDQTETASVADGIYTIDVSSSASMFRVVACTLTVQDGEMTAVLTLSGTGYGYLYVGTASEAAAADSSEWVPFVEDSDGKYTYTIKVSALDEGISVAAYSIKNDKWYDRTLTFDSSTLTKIADLSGEESGSDGEGTTDGTDTTDDGTTDGDDTTESGTESGSSTTNDGTADSESQYESDTSGSTSKVNSSTTLADGVYTPDKFSWSGGTGKVSISCTKITVTNGQAYATLVFSSDSYEYVKANGNTYYATKSGGNSIFVIPVALNQNNTIIGMTTKMSTAHEIEYTIFIYLAAAADGQTVSESSNEALDEEAPEIAGLAYESEATIEEAEYFKIYYYDQDIVLLEIDMTSDTARDPALSADAEDSGEEVTEAAEETDAQTSDESDTGEVTVDSGEETESETVSEAESAAELYKGNVVKYLLVPEGAVVPVGLEEDMIIVNLPADKTYAGSEAIIAMMESLGLLDNLVAVSMEQEDCENEAVAALMEADKEAQVVCAGSYEDLDYRTLLAQETNLMILPDEFLPQEAEDADEAEELIESGQTEAASQTEVTSEESTEEETELTVEEQTARFEEVTEYLAMYGIPVIVDRSADEETELAQYEWIKVYGVLFDCEEEAEALFETLK
ncbi:MAG: hypothetical protein LUH07_14765, partial [Lachnospiraceae bacterium]|nr:hypothetical protein [Lachnospiraceae bacterium]